ncbi:MAG: hypothetical protein M3N82_04775 [Pseudomonadota bacterium]|nr:hypothetical protein [Pseudomonadota bacterium]
MPAPRALALDLSLVHVCTIRLSAHIQACAPSRDRAQTRRAEQWGLEAVLTQVDATDTLYQKWLSDVESFKAGLRGLGEPKALNYVDEVFGRFAVRIERLAASSRGG